MDASIENGEAKVTCDQAFYPFGETQKTELLSARDLLDTCGRMHVLGRRESRKKIYSQRSWVRNWLAMQANNDWMKLT